MKRLQLLIFSTAVFCLGCTLGLAEPKGPKPEERATVKGLQLSISLPKENYGGGMPIEIESSIKNVTDKEISLGLMLDLKSYKVEVTTEKGEPVPLTRYGQMLYGIEIPPTGMGPFAIEPGGEAKLPIPLTRIYDMTAQDTYLVKVKRTMWLENEKSGEVATSDVLRIRVNT